MNAREHTRSDVCPPLGRVFLWALAELFLRMKVGIHPLLLGVSVGVRLLYVEEKVQPEDGLTLTRCRRLAPPGGRRVKARDRISATQEKLILTHTFSCKTTNYSN